MNRHASLALIGVLLLMAGCKPQHVVYVHNTTLGVDVTPLAEGTARLTIGYDRETFALVPRKDPKCGNMQPEAMSLAAFSRVYIQGLSTIEFAHLIATGTAAQDVIEGSDAGTIGDVVDRIFQTGKK